MKVSELSIGCLVKPKDTLALNIQPLYESDAFTGEHKLGIEELKALGFHHHATIQKFSLRWGGTQNMKTWGDYASGVAMYTGPVRLKGIYFGVRKQHTFLVDGIPIVMDGYEVHGFEKIQ